jgi:hypothetical protein
MLTAMRSIVAKLQRLFNLHSAGIFLQDYLWEIELQVLNKQRMKHGA